MAIYAIWLKGQLDPSWTEWFDPMTITNCRGGLAVLTGDIVDQAALHGILNKIRDLNLPLISLTFIEPGRDQA